MSSRNTAQPPEIYSIERKLGEGGTAEVFLAVRKDTGRTVALKRFGAEVAPDLLIREAAVGGHCRFPGLVRYLQTTQDEVDRGLLEIEYCPGKTLDSLAGKISETKLLAILSALAGSLYVLHNSGYVHNDLKDGNIYLPVGFEEDNFALDSLFYLKLADFSLATTYGKGGTQAVSGTVGYMSPEMILKKDLTPASDLFSLGVVAWHLAVGRLPFTSDTDDPLEVNARITEGDRPDPIEHGAQISDKSAALILSLLSVVPRERPKSAFTLAEDLARLGSPYPFRKAVRPKHLLPRNFGQSHGDLNAVFGDTGFSEEQQNQIRKLTGNDFGAVRLLLEYNFLKGNFIRANGGWRWRTEQAEVIAWPKALTSTALLPLKGTSIRMKKLALAAGLVGDFSAFELIAAASGESCDISAEQWHSSFPRNTRPLLTALGKRLKKSTKRIIAGKILAGQNHEEIRTDLLGKLLVEAGQYEKAITCLLDAAAKAAEDFELERAQTSLEQALDAAESLQNPLLQATVLHSRAGMEKNSGLIEQAEAHYCRIIDLLKDAQDDRLLAGTYKNLGDLYRSKSDYGAGVKALYHALQIYERLDDKLEISHTLNNLGNMHWIAGKYDIALDSYQRALEIQRSLNAQAEVASTLNNIGLIYLYSSRYKEAVSYFDQSLVLKEELDNPGEVARTLNNLGGAYLYLGDIYRSLEAMGRALEINREIGAQTDQLINLNNLAEAMAQAGRIEDCLKYLNDGTKLAERLNDKVYGSALDQMTGQLLRRTGQYDKAESRLMKALDTANELDNNQLRLPCLINFARLHGSVGEMAEKRASLVNAERVARELGDINALFYIALIQLADSGSRRFEHEAVEHLEKLGTEREKGQLFLTLLETSNKTGTSTRADEYAQMVRTYFDDRPEDIDLPRYYLAMGEFRQLNGDQKGAEELFTKAKELSRSMLLWPEYWQACSNLSDLYFTDSEFEQSFQSAQDAIETLKKIAAGIESRERLGKFYQDERIRSLLGRVKSLQNVLGKRKEAARQQPLP
jgi:serine/threonine protein kinase/Tfp pilus assembly protein PilF